MTHGTYDEQTTTLRFERCYSHPIDAVWRAVSEPEGLRKWFPAAVELDLRPGGAMRFTFPGHEDEAMGGEVIEVDPPRLLEFLWGEDRLRFEIEPDGTGALLRFMLDTEESVRSFDPDWAPPSGSPRMAIAFLCDSPEEVDRLHDELVAQGATSHRAPWDAFWGQRYASLGDPDGNAFDLFAPLSG